MTPKNCFPSESFVQEEVTETCRDNIVLFVVIRLKVNESWNKTGHLGLCHCVNTKGNTLRKNKLWKSVGMQNVSLFNF